MGWDVTDSLDNVTEMTESFTELMDSVMSGDYGEIAGDMADFMGDVMKTAAPAVSLFNPGLGTALAVGGAVLNAVEDGEITMAEVVEIGKTYMDAAGWGGLGGVVNENFVATTGIKAIAEKQVKEIMEKLINNEPVSDSDIDVLGDLISLLNTLNVKESDRSGRQNGEVGAGEGGGEGGAEAGGASGAGGAGSAGGAGRSGGSIFQVIASIFGEKMKEALGDMLEIAEEIKGADKEEVGKLTPEFTAAAQQFSFLSQSFNTGINALGEGLKSAARKQ